MSWALYLISTHHHVEQRILQELRDVFRDQSQEHELNFDPLSLSQLKYLNCVIQETLRLYPPVPISLRQAREDDVLDGHTIPKDVSCSLFFFSC
jgi:cytochrome P450